VQQFSLVVESKAKARELIALMWDTWGVRGEIALIPLTEQVKVDVISEKEIAAAQLDKLPGKRI
jgi:hypothetical protein